MLSGEEEPLGRVRRGLKRFVVWGGVLVLLGLAGLAAVNWWVTERRDRPVIHGRLTADDREQLRELDRLQAAFGDSVWPGLSSARIPVILYNDRWEFLVGPGERPEGWRRVDDRFRGRPYFRRRADDPSAFAVRVGDAWAASLATRERMNRDYLLRAREELPPVVAQLVPYGVFTFDRAFHAVLLHHEAFHAFQALRAPERFERARSAYAFESEYPFDDSAFAAAWDREGAALSRAMRAEDRSEACEAVRAFLSIRRERRQAVGGGAELARFERALEWLEGLAKYAEVRYYDLAAGADGVELAGDYDPELGRWSDEFRRLRSSLGGQAGDFRFYLSGMAQARALDALGAGWKGRLTEAGGHMEELLASRCRDPASGGSGAAGTGGANVPAACETVAGPVDRLLCLAERADRAGEPSPCDEAADEGVRYQCYAVFAERRGEAGACRRIPGTDPELVDLRDACLGDVAPVVGEPDLCGEIESSGLRDSCYLKVMRVTGDSALCGRIEDRGLRSACTGRPARVRPDGPAPGGAG